METAEFLKILESIKDLPTLPVIAFEVNRMLMNSSTSIDLLSETIKKDQSIVSKILKLVNSAFYGARSKVSTIHEAVIRLGFNSVRNIVVSVSVFDAFAMNDDQGLAFDIEDLWKHSVGVAITSKYLSEKAGLQDPDDCFVSGLLHDIGLIILAQNFPEVLKEMMGMVRQEGVSIYDAEKKLLQIRHNKIGELMAQKWQLPTSLCDALKYHHLPIRGAINPELITLVHLGDVICNRYMITSINPKKDKRSPILTSVSPQSEKILEKYFMYADDWFPEVYEKIKEACLFFINK
ncbi:MAG: HDOD domain-containing protein [Proteobacteria bacterium]|nr:HDOD domain-containing protein [Pseudomonadota bacterium]